MKAAELPKIQLNILATSDVHGVILPTDSQGSSGSLSQLQSLVTEMRGTQKNCLLLDNGDFLQGTPICDFAAEETGLINQPHPVITAMNQLGYDAAGLGNHEFDYGLDFLQSTLVQADFPVVGSNIFAARQNWLARTLLNHQVLDQFGHRHRLRVGIMSLLPEQVTAWNARYLSDDVKTFDIVETAERVAQDLRADGADLVICLLHSGIGADEHSPRMENAALPVAEHADIDALICGHTHRLLPDVTQPSTSAINYRAGCIHGIPTVMPGFNASHLGHITLELTKRDQSVEITKGGSQLHSIAKTHPDPLITNTARKMYLDCEKSLNRSIGHTDIPIHSYYSRLPGDPSVALSAAAQLKYAQAHLTEFLPVEVPVLSAASPFKGGGRGGPENFVNIAAGSVSKADLNRLHPFQNALVALSLTGKQLRDWLEMSASNFNQIKPETPRTPLRNAEFACYAFDTIFGITYDINLTQPARYDVQGQLASDGHRIQNLRYNQVEISNDQQFVLLTNSYRAGGGGNFPHSVTARRFDIPMPDSRKVLEDYIANGVRAENLLSSPWRFSPIPMGSAIVEIAPKAMNLLAQGIASDVPLQILGQSPNGFLKCQISLSSDVTQLACIP